MRNLTYILPICLCCFALWGQEKSDRWGNSVPSKEMLAKYKQNEGWVKLTAAIDRQKPIAQKLQSQINAQANVIRAKMQAHQDASNEERRMQDLRHSYDPVASQITKMEQQRKVIESEIKLREANKK